VFLRDTHKIAGAPKAGSKEDSSCSSSPLLRIGQNVCNVARLRGALIRGLPLNRRWERAISGLVEHYLGLGERKSGELQVEIKIDKTLELKGQQLAIQPAFCASLLSAGM
jgi:hypothetical protein